MTFQTDNKERRQSDKIIQELKTQMHEMTQQMEILQEKINTFEKSMEDAAEIWNNLRSVLRVFALFEKFCVWVIKIAGFCAALYAGWKIVILEFARYIKGQ